MPAVDEGGASRGRATAGDALEVFEVGQLAEGSAFGAEVDGVPSTVVIADTAQIQGVGLCGAETGEGEGGVVGAVDVGAVVKRQGPLVVVAVGGGPGKVSRGVGDGHRGDAGTGAGLVGERDVVDIAVAIVARAGLAHNDSGILAVACVVGERDGILRGGGGRNVDRVASHEGVEVGGVAHHTHQQAGRVGADTVGRPEAHHQTGDVDGGVDARQPPAVARQVGAVIVVVQHVAACVGVA